MNGIDSLCSLIDEDVKLRVYDWDFNVFEVAQRSSNRPLFAVTIALLETEGLLDGWRLDRAVVSRYLSKMESMYNPNPYHNNVHAADVTQTAAVIMHSMDTALPGGLTKLEKFGIIMAAAMHDLAHPGVNNDYLIKTRDYQALVYNDKSVNENMHVSKAFLLAASDASLDIFAGFQQQEFMQLRAWIVSMVLSTDMAYHFELLDKWKAAIAAQPDLSRWPNKSLAFQMLVHLADLANPSRPFGFALKWAEHVVTEFMQQGDMEAEHGLPVTPFCDRKLVCMPRAQLGFIKTFMLPTLECFRPITPGFVEMVTPWVQDTTAKWSFLEEAGVKQPASSYPPLPSDLGRRASQQQAQQQHQQQQPSKQPPALPPAAAVPPMVAAGQQAAKVS